MAAREKVDNFAGRICKIVLPIKQEYYLGRGQASAICTLSSLDLMDRISQMAPVMGRVAIVGRLLSENKGIDAIIKFAIEHPGLERIILCGKEVKGHRAGQALLSLSKNGIDIKGKIIGATGPYPSLRTNRDEIDMFRKKVVIVDLVGSTDIAKIIELVA